MRIKKSRSFSLSPTQTPASASLRKAIGNQPSLAAAADNWHSDMLAAPPVLMVDSLDDLQQTRAEVRKDLAWNSFLNLGPSPGGAFISDDGQISATGTGAGNADTAVGTNRAISSLATDAGGHDLTLSSTPYATGVGGACTVGNGALASTVLIGTKVKTLSMEQAWDATKVGMSLSLVTDSKIRVLGPIERGEDGIDRRMARFSSQAMPILDLGLGGALDHLGGGLRAAFAFGRAATYEKMVPVDQLAKMMRQRSGVARNLKETLNALGSATGLRAPSRRVVAADMGHIDAMRPGESATWKSTRVLVFGAAAGSFGARAVGTVQFQGSATYRLDRLDDTMAKLTVQPSRLRGARLAAELRLVADVACEYIRSASKQRAWTFDLTLMSSRQALQRAMRGHMPGILLPGSPDSPREAYAMLTTMQAEKLPIGVASAGSEFALARELSLAVGSLRLPSLLGGHSLGASESKIASVLARIDDGQALFARTHERQSTQDLLSLGSLTQRDSASLISAVSISPKGDAVVTPHSVTTSISRTVSDGGTFGRKRTVRSINKALGASLLVGGIQPSRRYAVDITQTLGINDIATAAAVSDTQVVAMAEQAALSVPLMLSIRGVLAKAIGAGSEAAYAKALAIVSSHGGKGIRALHALAGVSAEEVGVANSSHDQLLTDFFKAETYALGAKTFAQARLVGRRLQKLGQRIAKVQIELGRDDILRLVAPDAAARRAQFLAVLSDEITQLQGDIEAAMDTCQQPQNMG